MYFNYFGLKEPSFSIAPDPYYLFLSEQHKEALAHLLYGASENGGFVLLTGEVGTGKTTVCRAFLEQLPAGVEVAMVLNPAQSATELLLTLCDEFAIKIPEGYHSIKQLLDLLNQYLLEAHAQGRRPLLIIDEAQNLKPRVLEQIRLLTNLETIKHKLLQIFLIGQPELRNILASENLRQLNQRITARFHLNPFSLRETGEYIRHRLAVAGVERPLFTAKSIRQIHKHSGGIPRLMNLLCDRALLGACVTRSIQVTPKIVAQAVREVRGDSPNRLNLKARPVFLLAALITGIFYIIWLNYQLITGQYSNNYWTFWRAHLRSFTNTKQNASIPAVIIKKPAAKPKEPHVDASNLVPPSAPPQTPAPDLPQNNLNKLNNLNFNSVVVPSSEIMATQILLRRWGITPESFTIHEHPCAEIIQIGLRCQIEHGKLSQVRFFDLPALLRINPEQSNNQAGFIVLGALTDTEATLDLTTGSAQIPISELEQRWSGEYLLLWRAPPSKKALISANSSSTDIRWLHQLFIQAHILLKLNTQELDAAQFDTQLANMIREFQRSRGLQPDGLAGPRTLIQLQLAAGIPELPRLRTGTTITVPTEKIIK